MIPVTEHMQRTREDEAFWWTVKRRYQRWPILGVLAHWRWVKAMRARDVAWAR